MLSKDISSEAIYICSQHFSASLKKTFILEELDLVIEKRKYLEQNVTIHFACP